jgi:glycosyltransferase involved in cell wall biosynthesis
MAGQDTGGQAAKLTRAFNEFCPEHTMKSFSFSNPLGYHSTDFIKEQRETGEIASFISEADIIHVHNKFWYADYWFSKYNVKPRPNAAWVFHQHGRNHNVDYATIMRERQSLHIVSTHDLLPYVNGDISLWLPAPFDSREFDIVSKNNNKLSASDGIIRVCQSPTDRHRKNTDGFISIMEKVKSKLNNVDIVIIENMKNDECIKTKSLCDITFDQIGLAMGNSGIEAMFLRQPVIVGSSDNTLSLTKKINGSLPFVSANWNTACDDIIRLCSYPRIRKRCGDAGRLYVEKFHDYPANVKIVLGIYNKALKLKSRSLR